MSERGRAHETLDIWTIDLETPLRETQLYLAAVDVFRAAGYPPAQRLNSRGSGSAPAA